MSALETRRALHEDVELYVDEAVKLVRDAPAAQDDRVAAGHVVRRLVRTAAARAAELIRAYDDPDGALARELRAADGPPTSAAVFAAFHDRVAAARRAHAHRAPAFPPRPGPTDDDYAVAVPFSGEEAGGRCLDLLAPYQAARNLPGDDGAWAYVDYVRGFWDWAAPPNAARRYGSPAPAWAAYVAALRDYVAGFAARSRPLLDPPPADGGADAAAWRVDWGECRRRLYCVACGRRFAKATVYDAHTRGRRHAAAVAALDDGAAAMAAVARAMATPDLRAAVDATVANINVKMGRTARELDALARDGAADVAVAAEDVVREVKKKGIDNYPVGDDGKPIPYWLYKLHGLGTEYSCEVCGGKVYLGRRNYEKHFQEAQHIRGLRCLGIPNSVEFFDVCRIGDAVELWRKIQADRARDAWDAERDEEFEDAEGNVIPRRYYMMLVRQGLI